jgi:DNA-binding response OmpR family regulator
VPNPQAAPTPAHEVLIVEDHDDIRTAIGFLFKAAGFDVAAACSVEDAYRQVRQGYRPCVVLLDLHMPGTNGWVFLEQMRDEPHLVDVPVVIMSGDDDQRLRARRAGYEFLLKPTQPHLLLAAIGRHCRRHPLT